MKDSKNIDDVSPLFQSFDEECKPQSEVPLDTQDLYDNCRIRALHSEEVYPPSDDTFLMILALYEHLKTWDNTTLHNSINSCEVPIFTYRVLEIGSGSGMISAFVLRTLLRKCFSCNLEIYCTDKNPLAVICTFDSILEDLRENFGLDASMGEGDLTAESCGKDGSTRRSIVCDIILTEGNETVKVKIQEKHSSLLTCGKRIGTIRVICVETSFAGELDLSGDAVDLLIFNPPYVVTEDPLEMVGCGISISWAGGKNGREIIDDFIPHVKELLLDRGKEGTKDIQEKAKKRKPNAFFLCGIWENDPENIILLARRDHSLKGHIVKDEECGIERLWVIRFCVNSF